MDLATARNRAETPPLDKFIPRADYDAALQRASNAEQKLLALETEKRDAQISELIEHALKDGKISPATKDYHTAMCKTEGGIEAFKGFLEKAPALLSPESGLDKKKPEGTGAALNAEIQQVAAMFGNSAEDLRKYGGLT